MAKRIIHNVHDDMTDEIGAETYQFGLGAETYEIDLTEANAAALHAALDPYITAARRTGKLKLRGASFRIARQGSSNGNGGPKLATSSDKGQNQAIRDWWRTAVSQGIDLPRLSDRGKIPSKVVTAFYDRGNGATSAPVPELVPVAPSVPAIAKTVSRAKPVPPNEEVLAAYRQVNSYTGVAENFGVSTPTATKWVKAALAAELARAQ